MICRISGQLIVVTPPAAVIELSGVCYEVMMSANGLAQLEGHIGEPVVLSTIQYLEGNLAGSNLIPRLVGFLNDRDREFFNLLTDVRGISIRKALKTMAVPTHQLAAAIVNADVRLLTSLPEIGKKTAQQLIDELAEKMQPFLATPAAAGRSSAASTLSDAQRVALEILVSWGDRRADAQRWIEEAVAAESALSEPDAIVRAAYRAKQGAK